MSTQILLLRAVLGTMLASAIIHMTITFGRVIFGNNNWHLLNFFSLMDIYSVAPWLPKGSAGWWWSQVFCAFLFSAVLGVILYQQHKNQKSE